MLNKKILKSPHEVVDKASNHSSLKDVSSSSMSPGQKGKLYIQYLEEPKEENFMTMTMGNIQGNKGLDLKQMKSADVQLFKNDNQSD